MDGMTLPEILARDLGELEDHLKAGNQRIKSYYLDEYDPPEGFENRRLERPPHQDIIERGVGLIKFASRVARDEEGGKFTAFGDPEREAEFVLYGVGMECLLTGIYLQSDPQSFISYMESNDCRTPGISDSKNEVLRNLSEELDDGELSALSLLIDMVIKHRNNEVHLGFHRWGHHYFERLLLEVAVSLIKKYSDETISEVDQIQSLVDEMWSRAPAGADSREIQFDPW